MTNKHYDVIVIGAGIVGLTAAFGLAQQGFKLAVIDRKPPALSWDDQQPALRVSAINRASERILRALGVWDAIVTHGITPYHHMHVWDRESNAQLDFDSTCLSEANLGHIVENRIITKVLFDALLAHAQVDCYCPQQPVAVQSRAEHVQVELQDKSHLSAELLVGADGARSWVREQLHIGLTSWPYEQTALVATVKTAESHRHTAWQCFLPTGPLAFLPLTDPHHCSIVWSTSIALGEHWLQSTELAFNQALTDIFEAHLGCVERVSPLVSFPLCMRHADNYVANRAALIGDAAHTVHPLAGQGVNLGLLDAAALLEVITQARAKGKSIGSGPLLRRYQRWRRGENWLAIAGMEGFKQFFSGSAFLLKPLRQLGMGAVQNSDFMKQLFIKRAMGLSGDLPPLAKHY